MNICILIIDGGEQSSTLFHSFRIENARWKCVAIKELTFIHFPFGKNIERVNFTFSIPIARFQSVACQSSHCKSTIPIWLLVFSNQITNLISKQFHCDGNSGDDNKAMNRWNYFKFAASNTFHWISRSWIDELSPLRDVIHLTLNACVCWWHFNVRRLTFT